MDAAAQEFQDANEGLEQDKWKQIKQQKKQKAKQIKKILKERLNIDCLRMLCEDSPDESSDPLLQNSKQPTAKG